MPIIVAIFLILSGLSIYFSDEPALLDVRQVALQKAGGNPDKLVTGYMTTATLVRVSEILLDKNGGYISNDKLPPGLFMDNMPSWEFGVVVQMRDLARSLRNDMSRSQSQSFEDKDLAKAEPQFNFNSNSWIFPSTEKEYAKGIVHLEKYMQRLADPSQQNAQFFSRADNLREWLNIVGKRLGSYSHRLRSSIGQERVNTDLAGDSAATKSTPTKSQLMVKTPWLKIDNEFYEARGACWALINFLKAIEVDFSETLQKKNALVSLRQIIRELEPTQNTVWSPVILNGSGFALFANHSLVMASYISRANSAIIDLNNLLAEG
ncbi:MAG: DUF2333 family protein [Magnetococcales bacterium]|nr:DUF2333 family protein [Magnetococcales bacterium]